MTENFKENRLNPLGVTKRCLEIIGQNDHLNAFVRVTGELAHDKAVQSESRYVDGSNLNFLDGVPIAVKDNFCTDGVKTTCASNMLKDFVPTYSATAYQRMEKKGAVLLGKTNMDQFGMGSGTVDSIFGATKNPWSTSFNGNEWNIAGGSSGGSAVAVAIGMCYGYDFFFK